MPFVSTCLMLATEITYLLATMIYYCRENYIRACYLATGKLLQGVFLVIVFGALFLLSMQQKEFNSLVSEDA